MTTLRETSRAEEREFVIKRDFNVPRSLVFQAWTDPEHMAQWWGPAPFTNPVCEIDLRPGGTMLIVMCGPDGSEFPCKVVFREILPPERLVYVDDLSYMPEEWHDMIDPNRDKSAGTAGLEAVTTVTFEDLHGKTRLTVRTLFPSTAIRDGMLKIQMAEGSAQSLERLEALLAKV